RVGSQRAFDRAGRLAYLIAAPIGAGLVALRHPLVDAVFGHRYAGAADPMAIMAAPLCLAFLVGLQVSVLQGAGRARAAVRVAGMNAAMVVVLDLALIPRYGAVGAAMAMAGYQAAAVVLFARYIRRELGMTTPRPQA